jgi:hypothetical protein
MSRAKIDRIIDAMRGIPPRRQKNAVITDRHQGRLTYPRRELTDRLQRGKCELCQHTGEVEVHHIRNLKEPDRAEPAQ